MQLAEMRRWTVRVLGDHEGVDLVQLVADELAGNAIRHSDSGRPGGKFTVHLAAFPGHWHIRVDDAGGTSEPQLCAADLEDEGGRGLALVAALSSGWGVFGDHYARAVWAEIPMPKENEGSLLACQSGSPIAVADAAQRVSAVRRRAGAFTAATDLFVDTARELGADSGDADADVLAAYDSLLASASYVHARAGNPPAAVAYAESSLRKPQLTCT